MSKKISEIYAEYKIMPSLQEHMFRVAAVASLICDSFNEALPKEEIITACLLHDMGNIIKSELGYFPKFNEPEGTEYWQDIKNGYIKKYGESEHKATLQIMEILNVPKSIIDIVDKVNFRLSCKHQSGNNLIYKIVNYADWRVDPHGVVSYDERMSEAKERYQNRKNHNLHEEERADLVACGKDIEKQIFAKCKIKPEDINNETVKPIISELRNFVIE